jgi:hypothetical protein
MTRIFDADWFGKAKRIWRFSVAYFSHCKFKSKVLAKLPNADGGVTSKVREFLLTQCKEPVDDDAEEANKS